MLIEVQHKKNNGFTSSDHLHLRKQRESKQDLQVL